MIRYSWTARAQWHGRRLAHEGVSLSPGLIGSLGRHEAADVTVEAMRDFSRELHAAYSAERARAIEAGEV